MQKRLQKSAMVCKVLFCLQKDKSKLQKTRVNMSWKKLSRIYLSIFFISHLKNGEIKLHGTHTEKEKKN